MAVFLLPAAATAKVQNGVIAYSSKEDGDYDIWYSNADGTNHTKMTLNNFNEAYPAFSADGTLLAFATDVIGDRGYEIFVKNANDWSLPTNRTNANGDDTTPAFSPDGSKIAFASYRDNLVGDIFIMNADGSDQRNLTPGDDSISLGPTFSPDGARIAFYSSRDGDFDVYTISANGGPATNLTANNFDDREPSWSRDGTKIAFSSNREFGLYRVYLMDPNTGLVDNTEFFPLSTRWPEISPDGAAMVYSTGPVGSRDIEVKTLADNDFITVANGAFNEDYPAWQPVIVPDDTAPIPPVPPEPGKLAISCTSPEVKAGKKKRLRRSAFRRYVKRGFVCEMRNTKGVKSLGATLVRLGKRGRGRGRRQQCTRLRRSTRRASCKVAHSRGLLLTADQARKVVSVRYAPFARVSSGKLKNDKNKLRVIRRLRGGRYLLLFKAYIEQEGSDELKTKFFRFYLRVR